MMKRILMFLLPFLYCLILLIHRDVSFTQDLGRHIKTGEIILAAGSVPTTNLFSYTQPTHSFINHHWGSEVLFYLLYANLGLNSLLILKIVLVLASFGIVYFIAFKKNPLWAFVCSFPYLYIFSYRFYVRPELFSFLFISLFVFLILKYQQTKKILFLLPLILIELLWVNLHIYFAVGIILYGCFLAAEIIKKRRIDPRLASILAGLLIVTPVNPYGLKGALEPFMILNEYGYTIVENQSVFFLNQFFFDSRIFLFEVIGFVFVVLVILNIKKSNLFLVISGVVSTVLAYQMVRNFPIFILVSFPLFVSSFSAIFEKIKTKQAQETVRVILLSCLVGFVVWTTYESFSRPDLGFGYSAGAEKAVSYFEKNKLKGPIFNNFDIGGYLIFRLYPGERVFVDARPEAYSVAFLDKYKKIQENPKLFEKAQKKYKFKTIVFAHTDITPWAQTFSQNIIKNKKWKQVYLDESNIIFVRK